MSSAGDPSPEFVEHPFAILLEKLAPLLGEQVDYPFGGPTETNAFRGYDDRPIHQDRMRTDRVKQRLVGQSLVTKT